MSPPSGAVPTDNTIGEFGFDFKRFGVRVPTVLVSPRIVSGTVFNAPAGTVPLDHTSILKTVERRWGLPSLNARDAAAPDVGDSGTTLIAAERTGRICYAMELEPAYVETAIRRWQTWTGQPARHAMSNRLFDALAAENGGRDVG